MGGGLLGVKRMVFEWEQAEGLYGEQFSDEEESKFHSDDVNTVAAYAKRLSMWFLLNRLCNMQLLTEVW